MTELDRRDLLRWTALGVTAAAVPATLTGTLAPATAAESAVTWAAECGGQWRIVGAATVPVLATLLSIGPAPIPAGVCVRVTADATVVTDLSVSHAQDFEGAAVVGATQESADEGVWIVDWTLKQPLEVGAGLQLLLTVATSDDPRDLAGGAGGAPSTVSLITDAPDPRQRATGSEFVVG